MPTPSVIVIGASAGGVEALRQVVQGLPADFNAVVCVVLHIPAHGPSVLPRILSRAGPLKAIHPRDRDELKPGVIYVAPPDYHLLVNRDRVRVTRGPRENSHRPAADALFRTAATHYGRKVIGVVLSGVLDDGTAGLMAIKQAGGAAVVQHPDDALYPNMPLSALEHVQVDYSVPAAELPALLVRLAAERASQPDDREPRLSADGVQEADMAELEPKALHDEHRPGVPSGFACPECGGTLFEFQDGELLRFRCRIGHAYSANSLVAEQADGLEAALWAALRALEEQAALTKRLAERSTGRGHTGSARSFQNQAEDAHRHAELIRRVLLTLRPDPSTVPFDPARHPAAG